MLLRIFLGMLITVWAVMGLYTFIRMLMARLWADDRIFTVIELHDKSDMRMAESLIREVLTDPLVCRKSRMALLIPRELSRNESLDELCARYGVEIFLMEEKEK